MNLCTNAFLSGVLEEYYEIDLKDSWMYAAAEKKHQLSVGWEDSTMGNILLPMSLNLKVSTMKSEYDISSRLVSANGLDFSKLVVGMISQFVWFQCCTKIWKCQKHLWSYFCQISDSTTSYGSYSGAVPNEKITWGKLDIKRLI
jgi:deoxyhypusine synthase